MTSDLFRVTATGAHFLKGNDDMKQNTTSNSGGIGFVGLLTILFIGLKLTGYIAWPWVWVLSPIWISAIILLSIILVALVFIGLANR